MCSCDSFCTILSFFAPLLLWCWCWMCVFLQHANHFHQTFHAQSTKGCSLLKMNQRLLCRDAPALFGSRLPGFTSLVLLWFSALAKLIHTNKVTVMFSLYSLGTFMDILIRDPKNQRFIFTMKSQIRLDPQVLWAGLKWVYSLSCYLKGGWQL